eukprot:3204629-Rhodomonas_salina.1
MGWGECAQSMIGHCLGGAGGLEAVVTAKTVRISTAQYGSVRSRAVPEKYQYGSEQYQSWTRAVSVRTRAVPEIAYGATRRDGMCSTELA